MTQHTAPTGHGRIETNNFLMIVLITLVVAVGGLVEIVPLFFQKSTTQPEPGLKPLTPLQLAGRDIYIREGCYNCHSQMIRPFRAETMRYGPESKAGEFVYDHPFQWGSKRTGPDLARVGGRYSDEWHRVHLNNPRDVVPESNMPAYTWLNKATVNAVELPKHMEALKTLGVPYTTEDIAGASASVKDKTEMDAVVAYLQSLGLIRQLPSRMVAITPTTLPPTPTPTSSSSSTTEPPANTKTDVTVTEDMAKVVVVDGVIQFYFASGQSALAKEANQVLGQAVEAVKSGKKLQISGYHDAAGNLAKNQALAKERALAVRDALKTLGISETAIELIKPTESKGEGQGASARRVDVKVIG